jgi:hypothetical protein
MCNLEKIMDKQQEMPELSPEMREVQEAITKALIKSGQEARRLAEMTGTPLVVRKADPLQPPNTVTSHNE